MPPKTTTNNEKPKMKLYTITELIKETNKPYTEIILKLKENKKLQQYKNEILDPTPSITKKEFNKIIGD